MAKKTDAEIEAHIDAWYQKYRSEPVSEPNRTELILADLILADLVEFDFEKRLLILHLSNERRLVLPLEDIQGLGAATKEQLEDYDLQEGQGIEWPELGVAYRIGGLLEGLYGNQLWMQEMRRKGGASKSEAKQQAARTNGVKGGRPRKEKVPA